MTVDELRFARLESTNVAYLTFIKHIRQNKNGLFCFFEGKDSPYYNLRIKQVYTENYHAIICNGKKNVLNAYSLIKRHKEYNAYKKGFFVDRDYDESINNEEIYETPYYSIENFYTSSETFKDILKNELNMTEIDNSYTTCMSLYIRLQQEYHESSTLFNAWYACTKENQSTSKITLNFSLDNIIPREFVDIKLSGVASTYTLNDILLKYKPNVLVSPIEVDKKIIEFNLKNKGHIFRGKYEMYFLIKFINELVYDSKSSRIYVSGELKYNITNTQVLSQFSQYAETPRNLIEYIGRIAQ